MSSERERSAGALESPAPDAIALREAQRVLEAVIRDRTLLAQLSHEERQAFLIAAGRTVHPELEQKRKLVRALRRTERLRAERHDRGLVATTGIRAAREASVFVPPPKLLAPVAQIEPAAEPAPAARAPELLQAARLLRLQDGVPAAAPVLRLDVSGVRGAQLREALPERRSRRTRGGRHRGPRQDRLSRRAQAAAGRGHRGRDDALPARCGAPLRGRAGLRRLARSGCACTASTCATRRASRSSAASSGRSWGGWTCWSTTPARPCAGRRASTSTCSSSRRARSRTCPRSCGRCCVRTTTACAGWAAPAP